ncbi:hypothetical protein XENOCAPTIV_004979, partial [Xenoophorus captivus]
PLTKAYQEVLRTVFMSSGSSSSGANKKKSMKDLQEEITNLYNNIRLFEKGTKMCQFYLNIIGADETQVQITKHVLKTVCTDVTNILVNFLAADLMMSAENPSTITNEVCFCMFEIPTRTTRGSYWSWSGSFLCRFRQAQFLHRQALTEQLKEVEDPALVLHLTSVLLFQASTHCMLHAPGRCVPQIIGTLTGRIPTVRLTQVAGTMPP